jgi:hypothetical protein
VGKEKNEDTHEGDDPGVMHSRTRHSLSHEEQVVNNTNRGGLPSPLRLSTRV